MLGRGKESCFQLNKFLMLKFQIIPVLIDLFES